MRRMICLRMLVTLTVVMASTAHARGPGRASSSPASPSPASSRARAEVVERMLDRFVPFGFSGAVALIERGDVVLARGFGSRDSIASHRIDRSTGFDIGSMSKTLTAAVILRLADAGRLSIDDSLASFYPDAPPDRRSVTLRQLLTHTAGLDVFHDLHGDFEAMTRDTAESRILHAPLAEEPGTFAYSNSGYTLLAAIAERVTGTGFPTLLRREVLGPASMEHAGLYADARWGDEQHLARGSIGGEDAGSPKTWTSTPDLWALIGNGGVVCTLDDLIAWDRALRTRSLWGPATDAEFVKPQVNVGAGVRYALGWFVREDSARGRSHGHTGANDFGFASGYEHFETADRTVILLVNAQPERDVDIGTFRDAMMRTIERAWLDGDATMPPPVAPLSPAAIEPLCGRWRLDDGSMLDVVRRRAAVRITAEGPRASIVLAGLDRDGVARADSLVGPSARVAAAMLADDYGPLQELLRDPAAFPREHDYLAKKLAALRERGPLVGSSVVSITPGWWSGDSRLVSILRIEGTGDSLVFRLHWDRGRIAALGGNAIRRGPALLVGGGTTGQLAGFDPMTQARLTIERLGTPPGDHLRLVGAGTIADASRVAR